MTKICTKCGETKPVAGFGHDRRLKDGLASRCKACRNATNRDIKRAHRAIPANRLAHNVAVNDAVVIGQRPNTSYPSDRTPRRAVYAEARRLGPGHEVDHIVPLSGNDYVSGLHVSWNLQILTRAENRAKRFSFHDWDALAPISNFRVPPAVDVSQFYGF